MTLVYLRSNNKVLLLKLLPDKKVQPNVWLGLGGKVEPGEELLASACREFQEETGLTLLDPVLRGTHTWTYESSEGLTGGILYIFGATQYTGSLLAESDEGELAWHDITTLRSLEDFAPHQYDFIDHALGIKPDFYSAFTGYNEASEPYLRLDSREYFLQREQALQQ